MKKNVLRNVFLILLPAMSVLLAAATDSVTVFDTVTGEVSAYSYFSMVPVANLQMCTPLAAMIAVAATALAVGIVATGKSWCVKGLFWTAFAATDKALNVKLKTGFHKREETGTKTNSNIFLENL